MDYLLKDVTERLNLAESRITCMNTEKAKLDERLQARRPSGLKSSLGYVCKKDKPSHVNKASN